MSRIRSVHPGVWTDELFVSVTAFARLLFMGLWNECDDNGSFEWSPLKLKMRLLPADNVDAAELLTELVNAGMAMKYEVDGKMYGAIRNFCQYQRPKKPNSLYPQTEAVREWVNIAARSTKDGSEPVPHQFGTSGEKSRQRKEEGGREGDIPLSNDNGALDPEKVMFDQGIAYFQSNGIKPDRARPFLGKLRRDYGAAAVIEALGTAQRQGIIDPMSYLPACLKQRHRPQPAIPI